MATSTIYHIHLTTKTFFTATPPKTEKLSSHTYLEDANYAAVQHFEERLGRQKVDGLGIWDEAALRMPLEYEVVVDGKQYRMWVVEDRVGKGV